MKQVLESFFQATILSTFSQICTFRQGGDLPPPPLPHLSVSLTENYPHFYTFPNKFTQEFVLTI